MFSSSAFSARINCIRLNAKNLRRLAGENSELNLRPPAGGLRDSDSAIIPAVKNLFFKEIKVCC